MWQSEQGIAIVRATYNLMCKGAEKISFKFPNTAHFESCYLNSKQITANRNEENPDRLWISVPYNSSKQILSLNYKVNGPVAAGPTKVKLLLPECSFQVQHHRWNLYTSPNLVVEQAETLKADQSLYWWQRLFGPIARHPQSHIFNPTKQVHWQQLWASLEKRRPGFKKTQRTLTNTEYGISPGDLNSDTGADNDHESYFMGNKWSTEFLADPPTVIIAKRNQSNALWYVIWFLTLATGSWLISNRATFVMVLTAAFSIACLLAPTSWLTIFQAAFLGLLAAMALHLLLMILVKDQSSDANLENTAAKSAFSLLLIISFGLQGTCSLAEDSVPKLKPDIPKVFFPIDRSGALQGDDVFVDEVYLKQLKQVSETNFSSHADYLIHEIRYSGALSRQTTVQGQDVTKTGSKDSPWSIQISVESFSNDVALELPLSQEDAKWLAGTHLLDGAPISIEWGQPEGTCKVKLPKSGYHRLELFFHPQVASLEERNLINMRVPSFPAARLGLSTDSSLVDLQIENSIPKGKVSTSSFHEFDLGPQDLLHISWKPETSRNISPWNGNLDLLSWLHIEPARARLHVQAVCKHSGKGTCEFELSYPAQLKHIAEDADHDNYRIEAIETDNRILIKADTYIDGEVRIPLEFEFKRSVSLGEIYFPVIKTNNPSPSRSLFAVSVDSRLSYSEKSGINLQGITPGEFAEGWGSTDELPLFAYSLGSPEADWSIQVWPAPISYTAQQRLEVLCQPEKAQLAYEANIENLTSELLVHRLRVPPNLELKSLMLINQVDKETIPTRWSRITQDEVFIFLDRPLQQPHKLSLVGTVPLETPGKFVPPYMGLLAAERNKIRLELLRTRDVLVNWTNPDQAPEELPIQASTRSSDEIPIGVYSWSSDGLELNRTLNIHENDARIESESCLEIEKTEVNAWQATLHAMVKVKSGVVDRLRVSVPDSLSENFRLLREQTGVLIKSNSSVDKDIVTLLLSKPLEAGEVLDFHLTSELEVPVNQQVSIPDIKLLDSTAEEKYLVLPTQSAGESIAWHRPRGLRKRRIPNHILKMIDSEVAKLQFQIDSDTFSISQRSQRGSLNKAAIRNMEVVGSLDLQGNLSMVAHVILQPGRATSCSIRFPDHCQVTGIKVDGFFVRGQKRKDGTWSIPVGPPYLPREISLSYFISDRDQGSDTEVLLPAPRILLGKQELPLPLVFWQIRPLGEVRFANKISGNRISAKDFALHRHDALLSTLEIAYPQLMSLSSFESASWLSSWLNKIEQSSSMVETSKRAILDNNLIPSNSNPVYDDQAQQELLDLVNSYMESLEFIPNASPENSGVIQDALKSEDKFFTSNENGEIILSIHRGEYPSKERWLASLAILALSLIGLRTRISTASWIQTIKKYPYLLAFLVGLTWWLCFRPSAFGLVLMGIVLAAKIKTRLHDYQKQRDQSISTQIASRTT